MNLLGKARLLDDPGQVRSLNPAIAYRTRDAEAGGLRTGDRIIEEPADDFSEFAVFAAGKNAFGN
jgi:hypothetical protein